MQTYSATFIARRVGAGDTGIFYQIQTLVEGKDENEARLNLYSRFEHISELKLTPTGN